MASFQRFIGGLKGLIRSRRVEQELDEELRRTWNPPSRQGFALA